MMNFDDINMMCAEIAAENAEQCANDYAEELEMQMLLSDPRFFGPDFDYDCDGLFYWDLK